MEVQLEPALQAKLEQLARDRGRDAADLVHDAVAGYVSELVQQNAPIASIAHLQKTDPEEWMRRFREWLKAMIPTRPYSLTRR